MGGVLPLKEFQNVNKRTYQDFLQTISRSPTQKECRFLANHMREADKEEARAAGALEDGRSLAHNLIDAVGDGAGAVVVYEPGTRTPVAIYGVAVFPAFPDVGFLWMQGTEALGTRCKQDFLRLGRFGVEELRNAYRLLVCFADARNTLHTRWLRWAGFTPISLRTLADPAVPFFEFVLPGTHTEVRSCVNLQL